MSKVFGKVVIAGAIGYIAGLLFAPKKGEETRKDLKKQADKLKKQADVKKKQLEKATRDGVKSFKNGAELFRFDPDPGIADSKLQPDQSGFFVQHPDRESDTSCLRKLERITQ